MKEKKRKKDAELTAENKAESAKLLEFWKQAKAKLGKKLTQAKFGADYGIGEQGMVWQCLNGQGAAISLNAARGFVQGLNEAGIPIELADFSPRLAAEAEKNSALVSPVLKRVSTDEPRTGDKPSKSNWPFSEIEFERWARLSFVQQGMVQKAMLDEIEKIEARVKLKTGTGN